MQWSKTITVVGTHAERGIRRVITAGVIDPPGSNMGKCCAFCKPVEHGFMASINWDVIHLILFRKASFLRIPGAALSMSFRRFDRVSRCY